MIVPLSAAFVAVIVGGLILWETMNRRRHRTPLPPGPPRRWIVGNLFDFPKTKPWETFDEWRKEYGDVVYMDIPGKPMVILGSIKAANDLLEKRSHLYSDRPQSVMLDLLSWGWAFSTMPYGVKWRTHRRYFHEHFSQAAIRRYHSAQLQETYSLLIRLLDQPALARQHIRSLPGSTIIRVVYGAKGTSQVKGYVRLAEQGLDSARKASVPGAFLAEFIPILKYIPSWLPGGSARKFAAHYRSLVQQMRDRPFDEVKADMNDGKSVLSVAYNLIRQMQAEASADDLSAEQDTIARNVAGVAYAGAADTTTAAAESFVLAMAMYPDVQKRAQAELDAIVGPSRLPGFSDLDSLTYVRAVVMENLRWMPTVPLGIPHRLIEDDEYNGNHIPKGAIITPNVWAMMHNSDDYPEPETFKPERFIGSDGNINSAIRDPRTIAFGFGRRACPGSDFAISLLSICVASMLHVFDIQAGIDDHGQPVILSSETGGDAIASPLTFPRRMRSRSIQAERLIRDAALDAEEVDLL